MSKKKSAVKHQQIQYNTFLTCSAEDLEGWYNAYINGYPRHVAPMIRALATARDIDTSNWQEWYE
jgi:hypothetical protein